MDRFETSGDDSPSRDAAIVPGSDGVAAFKLRRRKPMAIPVLIAVPHAGRAYPNSLLKRLRHVDHAPLRLEDRYVDLVAEAVARETGAVLLVAHAPRAMIDLNRSPEDIDWEMVSDGDGPVRARFRAGRRARSGLGLVPRRLPGLGELWNSRLTRGELAERVELVHNPYHAALARTLDAMKDRWGVALLLDLHSMPPLSLTSSDVAAVDYVIGDRFGGSCESGLVRSSFEHFEQAGVSASHNRPYAGGYVLDRHGAPARHINAIQLEICRAAYLDNKLREPGAGMADVVRIVTGLVHRLADDLTGTNDGLAEAAE